MSAKTRFYLFRTINIFASIATVILLLLFWFNVLDTRGSQDYVIYILLALIVMVIVFGELGKRAYLAYIDEGYAPPKKNFFYSMFFQPIVSENALELVMVIIIPIVEALLILELFLSALHINDMGGEIATIVLFAIVAVCNLIIRISRLARRKK